MNVQPCVNTQKPSALSLIELRCLQDERVLAELLAGNGDALAVLFDRYHRLVYSIALKIVRDAAEAEDVMQVVFFDIFRSVAQFDPSKGTCKVWLLQYVYHRAINRRQQLNARYFYNMASMEDAEGAVAKKQSIFKRFTQTELKQLIREGLASLNATQRRVIELATYQGLSMREISVQSGESLVNVRHHYYRGLKKLRLLMSAVQKGGGGGHV
jgi:RNA polymerase sigma-70 factor, ECF subfamily